MAGRSQSAHHRRDGPAAARQILRGRLHHAIIVHRAPRGDEIVGGALEPRRPGAQLRHESRRRQVGFFGPSARPRLTDDWTAHARTHTQRRESLNTATAGVIVRRVCVRSCVRLCECSGPRRLNLCFAICAERRCERAKPPAHSHSRARGGPLGGVRGRCDSEMMKRIRPTAGKMNPARITL